MSTIVNSEDWLSEVFVQVSLSSDSSESCKAHLTSNSYIYGRVHKLESVELSWHQLVREVGGKEPIGARASWRLCHLAIPAERNILQLGSWPVTFRKRVLELREGS